MNDRQPYAMKTLIKQVLDHREDVSWHSGDIDGFGVHRSVQFDVATSEWLSPLISLFKDDRMESVTKVSDGQILVTFVTDPRADMAHPFLLPEVNKILNEEEPKDSSLERPKPAAKKAPAKRAPRKKASKK